MVTLFLLYVFKWCFGFGETYPNEKYEIKKNLCTKKKMVEASASALAHQKWGGPVQTQFFKIKIKRLTHIDMMNQLIPNTVPLNFKIPKLHQSVVLQVRP